MSSHDMAQLVFFLSAWSAFICWLTVFRPAALLRIWNAIKAFVRWPADRLAAARDPYRSIAAEEAMVSMEEARLHRYALEDAQRRGYPAAKAEPWTPAERDALGINDTEKFILDTQAILNGIEWERTGQPKPATVSHVSRTGITRGPIPKPDAPRARSYAIGETPRETRLIEVEIDDPRPSSSRHDQGTSILEDLERINHKAVEAHAAWDRLAFESRRREMYGR